MFLALIAAAALPFSGLLADQDLVAALGGAGLKPGAWAEYLVRSGEEGEARVRVTALAEGDRCCWVEIAAAGASGVAGAVRVLLRGADIERMQVLLAGQQPVEIPLDRVGPARSRLPREKARRAGKGRVKKSIELLASGTAGGRSVFPDAHGKGSESAK